MEHDELDAYAQPAGIRKRQFLAALPRWTLILHLNRSLYDSFGAARRNNCSVAYPKRLRLRSVQGLETEYRLTALITHTGSHSHGHYVCFRWVPSARKWIQCNDERVTLSSGDTVFSQTRSAYLLVYSSQ